MKRTQAFIATCKRKQSKERAITKEAEGIAKEFWGRWKGKKKNQILPALMQELEKMNDNRIAEVLAYAKIINKFKPSLLPQKGVAQ